jgi:hypothetical protein
MDWINTGHKKYWESLAGHAELFLEGPSARRTKELLNRNQFWRVTGLLTGHCHLEGHLFRMEITSNPICERFLKKNN